MKNGGLGVACFGLTRELIGSGVEVIFVLPKKQDTIGESTFIFADNEEKVKVKPITSALVPYQSGDSYIESIEYDIKSGHKKHHRRTIVEEIKRFAVLAQEIALTEQFDLIHAHDWTSYPAGVAAKIATGKPLMLHVHATAFDQAGGNNVDPAMYQIESDGFAQADIIVAVSEYTKKIILEKYQVDPVKVTVVHNGCDVYEPPRLLPALLELKKAGRKIVLYHGRITIQKGVDYFVRAARRVVDVDPSVVFVISGWGDMTNQIIEQVGQLQLSANVIFAGALWDEDRDRMYQSADLVVMPSVSEPFGLVPLEAMQHGTPSLISKQSGVSEVMSNTLKVDFWDVEEMANLILSALRYEALRTQLVTSGKSELTNNSWNKAAVKVNSLYRNLLQYS